MSRICSQPDCDRGVRSRGLCGAHYQRLVKGQDLDAPMKQRKPERICSAPSCDRPADSRGLCGTHYVRRRRGADVAAPVEARMSNLGVACSVAGCERPAKTRHLCSAHYQRLLHGKPLDAPWRVPTGRHMSSDGYVLISVTIDGKQYRRGEHRMVMSEIIGRPLKRSETVHHRNGDRADNRPSNLELWTSPHQPGQRVTDLLAWARAILDEYAPIEDRLT